MFDPPTTMAARIAGEADKDFPFKIVERDAECFLAAIARLGGMVIFPKEGAHAKTN